ncbi:MAG TPA: hypothetical protein VF789_16500 [Thermoanaerobaculia bacterium]
MPDQVTAFLSNGKFFTDQTTPAGGIGERGVVRVEIKKEGSDEKLILYTDPNDEESFIRNSDVALLGRVVEVHAPIRPLFSDETPRLNVIIKDGRLLKIRLAKRDLPHQNRPGNLFEAWRDGRSFTVLDASDHELDRQRGFFQQIGFQLSDSEPDTSGLRCALHPVNRKNAAGDCVETKDLTLVFETTAKVAGQGLKAYGSSEGVSQQTIRLVQIPRYLVCGDAEAQDKIPTWYVALMGLPYSWGRSVWNSVMGELVRASELDVQHGPLFAPIFDPAGSGFWDSVYEVQEPLSTDGRVSAVSHALALHGNNDDTWGQATFPLLRNHIGEAIKALLPLTKGFPADLSASDNSRFRDLMKHLLKLTRDSGLSLRLRRKKSIAVISPNRSVRIGALDVTFASSTRDTGKEGETLQKWMLTESRRENFSGKYEWNDASMDLDWSIEALAPGGQDDVTGEFYADCDPSLQIPASQQEEHDLECTQRRERPLVVPLPKAAASPLTGIVLNVQERARQGDLRRIDLVLRRTDGGGNTGDELKELEVCFPENENKMDRVAVLDREPFLVAKVSFPTLGSLENAAAGNEIANWQSYGSDAGTWHIRFPNAQNFCLTLPPQGVGETMEKRKEHKQGLAEGDLADFRLSPPAFLAMRERYYKQNFPEAPWNLRRLLSDPERELPGAHLEHLQYELLYGLSCRIDYPFMRLAEISALVGDVMGPLPRNPAWVPFKGAKVDGEAQGDYLEARRRWIRLAQRTRQRLGIFELWDIRKLDTLELKEDVTCWIRQMPRDHHLPGDPTDEPSDETKRPKTLPDGLVKVRKADLANPVPLDPDAPDPGLKGGATWGFESRNIYQAVLRPHDGKWPQSSGAAMKDTRLSALGGYGHQMAAFDNWRTKILADVSMGRTWSYTLERIGRVGVCWNRCKHVIVYERTVVRSPLFGPKAGKEDAQNPHEGRAVLRKVDEFVEVLQNSRRYPDQGKGDAKATGFITECSFSEDPNQVVRFRVRGSWGTDVGNVGWKIPIWRPGEEPKELFPKPVVHFTVMASVDGESVPRKVAIANPENLYFYTDTTVPPEALDDPSVDLSNTDAWLPVEGVDFVDQARPGAAEDNAFASGSLKQTSAGDTVVPIGFSPCTFLIEPAEHTVDLLANRKGDPMGALLSSVTMCRADFQVTQPGLSDVLGSTRSYVAETIQRHLDLLPADARRFDANKLEELKTQIGNLCNSAGTAVADRLAEPAARLQEGNERLQKIGGSLTELIEKIDNQAKDKINLEARRLTAWPARLVEELQANKGNLKKALHRHIETIEAQMKLAPSLAPYLGSVEGALNDARSQLKQAQVELQQIDKDLDTWVAAARLSELTQRLRIYRSTLQSISQRIRGYADSASLTSGDDKIALGIGAKWVAKNLSTLTKVAGMVDAVDATLASVNQLVKDVQGVKGLAKTRLRKLEDQTADLQAVFDEAEKLLSQSRAGLKKAEDGAHALFKELATQLIKETEKAIDELADLGFVEGLRRRWEDKVQTENENLKKGIDGVTKEVRSTASAFFASLDVKELLPTKESISKSVEERCSDLKKRFEVLLTEIKDELGIQEKVAEIRSFLERQRDEALRQIEEELGSGIKAARQVLGVVESKKDDVLKLVRAFGTPPDVSGLKFDRPEVAFFYNELKDRVDITPVISRAAQAAAIVDALKPFGVDLPVKELGEQLIPAELRNFDVSSILPNIAGIPLKDLFSGLKMPGGSGDAVKVRHGLDPQTRRAWVNTEINFQASENATLFAVGPLAVRVNKPRFEAEARMEADLQGIRQRKVSGQLAGDWLLQIGGFPLITFRQTPLTFDEDGRINFRVNPQDVQLAPALDFINALMSQISPGGLTTRFDGDGVVSTLDLPIPDTQVGAFGFSGLKLCASLALRYGGGDFNIGVTAGLARRDAPFTLTVFILGGAGYLELGSRYHTSTGKVTATADMAIAVSASLGIALGPIRGGVAVYLGVTANYDSARGGGLVVGLMFMIRGHVSVLSIASATITLRLDGQYQGGAMVGTGHLEIKIKICWCFTLEVSESVQYTLGRVGSNRRSSLGGPRPVAQLASLGGMAALGMEAEPVKIDKINPEKLKAAVENYLDMLV